MWALFFHYDGAYALLLAQNQNLHPNRLLEFPNDFLQGIGGVAFLINYRMLPFFWPIRFISDPLGAKLAVYVVIAAAIFMFAYGLTRLLSPSRPAAIVAGWLLGLIATPVSPWLPIFYPILYSAPVFVLVVVWPLLAFWLICAMGRGSIRTDVLLGGLLAGWLLYLLGTCPFLVPIVAIGTLPYLALSLALARSGVELRRKVAVLTGVLSISLALRWPWYVIGLFRYTAPSMFPDDFNIVYTSAEYVSIMFQRQLFGWTGPLLVAASVAGAVLSIRAGAGGLRAAAWTLLITIGAFLCLGVIVPNVRWILPPPIYVEVALWPLYAMFAGLALVGAARALGAQFSRFARAPIYNIRSEWILPLPAALATFIIAHHPPTRSGFPYPPHSAGIVDILRKNVALGPEAEFRGRVATILPVDSQGGDPWTQQQTQAAEVATATGNDYLSIGLWYYLVPTLFEYNQFISPGFHALIKRALQIPPLLHQRNITVITTPNLRVMELLGVRYIIAPAAGNSLGAIRQVDSVVGKSLQLSELPRPNLASYSPTTVVIRHDLKSALDIVADDDVDLAETAVVYDDVPGPLVRANSTSLSMVDGDLHLAATSTGRSLIVVPVEYSHCLELSPARGDEPGTGVSLKRVQGVLTGVAFEHQLDVVLAFRMGPLHNPLCLFEDYQDFKMLSPSAPSAGSRQ